MGLLVVNVDHLPPHLLGPYGNSTVPTPTLNQWAGRGGVVDWAFHGGPWLTSETASECMAMRFEADLCLTPGSAEHWTWPPATNGQLSGIAQSLPAHFRPARVPWEAGAEVADRWETTAVAGYLERALSQWARVQPGSDARVWLDLPLMGATWDAPRAWREYLAGDEDPEVYLGLESPYLRLPSKKLGGLLESSGLDPDLRLSYEHAAGAMVMLLDHALEWLQNCLQAIPGGAEMPILLTAETGFGLGEHLEIGSFPDAMWSEQTHVPLIFYLGAGGSYPFRISGVQSQSQLLRHWWGPSRDLSGGLESVPPQTDSVVDAALDRLGWLDYTLFGPQRRDAVISVSANQIAVRTNAWSFLWKAAHSPLLFVRPDDRFEQNDLSSRCRDVTAGFQWFLPELFQYFGGAQRQIPQQFRQTWLNGCQVLADEGYHPSTANLESRAADRGNRVACGELPAELWTNVV